MRLFKLLTLALLLSAAGNALADTRYEMRVDGLACPYCAYGVEKKLKAIKGARDIDIDLDRGLVSVTVPDEVELGEERLRQLFTDAGFTYRSMQKFTL